METKIYTIALAEIPDDADTIRKIRNIAKKYKGKLELWEDTFHDGADSEGRVYGVQDRHTSRIDSELSSLGINVFDIIPENH